MKSALQLELEDLNGLPFIAGIIWFVLLGVCLLAIAIYLIRKNIKTKESPPPNILNRKKSKPKGF